MNENQWEMFDALYRTAHRQGRLIEELERRVEALGEQLGEMQFEARRRELRDMCGPVVRTVDEFQLFEKDEEVQPA